MDYRRIYQALCTRGQQRVKQEGVYYERHHIKPKSFGGRKTKVNLTLLTLKEHYLAHRLLVEIYPTSNSMKSALWIMCNTTPFSKDGYKRFSPSIRVYERLRIEYAKHCSIGENNPRYGKPVSEKSREVCRQRSIGNTYTKGRVRSKEEIERWKEKRKLTVLSEEDKLKALENLKLGWFVRCKEITCLTTGEKFKDVGILGKKLGIPANTISNWFRGRAVPPEWFHYTRDGETKKESVKESDPIFLKELEEDLENKIDKRNIAKKYSITTCQLKKYILKYFPRFYKRRK
jgi:hypothetical protein